MKNSILFVCLFVSSWVFSQELSCKVTVNTQQVNQTNQKIFQTLEKSLQEFINQTAWTSEKVLPNEKIDCSFTFIITNYENNNFRADVQIQSTRPVYGSTYQTTILNYLEKDVAFSYLENEPLYFNPNSFGSNLSSFVAYYSLIIIGLDADSFSLNGGEVFYKSALATVLNAQTSTDTAWQQTGKNNRWQLVSDLLSDSHKAFRTALYGYHLKGLDLMESQPTLGKENMSSAILELKKDDSLRLNSMPLLLFFNAKADEISQVFSSGKPIANPQGLKEALEQLSQGNIDKWQQIK